MRQCLRASSSFRIHRMRSAALVAVSSSFLSTFLMLNRKLSTSPLGSVGLFSPAALDTTCISLRKIGLRYMRSVRLDFLSKRKLMLNDISALLGSVNRRKSLKTNASNSLLLFTFF